MSGHDSPKRPARSGAGGSAGRSPQRPPAPGQLPPRAPSGAGGSAGRSPQRPPAPGQLPPRAPRARDLPGPRRGESVTAPALRWLFQWPYRFALAGLYRLGLRAWHLTALSVVAAAGVGTLLFAGLHLAAGFALLGAGLLDLFDGALARLRGEESRQGALLDSVVDRVADTIVYGSLFISEGLRGARLSSGLALGSLVVGLFVSHLRAQAEASGATVTEGMFQRPERVVVLALGLTIPGALVPALALLTAMGTLTVAQRLVAAWRRLPRTG